MKIALLVPNFTEYSGDARVVESQAKELSEEGHEVSIYALSGNMGSSSAEVILMGMPNNLFLQRIYRLVFPLDLFKLILWMPKFKKYDRVIAHLYPMTYLCSMIKKFYGTEYIFWFHGIEDPNLFPHFYEKLYTNLHIYFTKKTTSNVNVAVSVSEFARKKLKEYTGLESTVIYNKVDNNYFNNQVDPTLIRIKYGIPEEAPIILSVGRLAPQKGVDLLLRAFKLIQLVLPSARLVIVGDKTFDYYYEKLKSLSDSSVIFAGHVSPNEMPYYYAMCNIYASCSLWENHNLPVIEAQLCGKPVVAFDIDAFKEQIDAHGILVKKGNLDDFAEACICKISEMKKCRT